MREREGVGKERGKNRMEGEKKKAIKKEYKLLHKNIIR